LKQLNKILSLIAIIFFLLLLSNTIDTRNNYPISQKLVDSNRLDSSAVQTLVDSNVAAFTMNDTHIFWAKTGSSATIYAKPLVGGSAKPLVFNQDTVKDMAVRGNYLAWTTIGGGTGQNGTVIVYNCATGSTLQLADVLYPNEIEMGTPFYGFLGVWVLFTTRYMQLIPDVKLCGGLYSIKVDGTNFRQLYNEPVESPRWSPNDDTIIFCHNETEIYNGTYDNFGLSIICTDTNIRDIACDKRPFESQDITIFYSSDEYDLNVNGFIKYTTHYTGTITTIKTGIDVPHGLACAANELVIAEYGYFSTAGKIARMRSFGAFDDFMYITGWYHPDTPPEDFIGFPKKVEINSYYVDYIGYLSTYNDNLYVHIMYDDDGPLPPHVSTSNKTIYTENWIIEWQDSIDLNGIEQYQIQESMNPDFSGATSYTTSATEYPFTDKANGTYYYRIRARDNVTDPSRDKWDGTLGNWSTIVIITYMESTGHSPIPSFEFLFTFLVVIGYSLWKQKRNSWT